MCCTSEIWRAPIARVPARGRAANVWIQPNFPENLLVFVKQSRSPTSFAGSWASGANARSARQSRSMWAAVMCEIPTQSRAPRQRRASKSAETHGSAAKRAQAPAVRPVQESHLIHHRHDACARCSPATAWYARAVFKHRSMHSIGITRWGEQFCTPQHHDRSGARGASAFPQLRLGTI